MGDEKKPAASASGACRVCDGYTKQRYSSGYLCEKCNEYKQAVTAYDQSGNANGYADMSLPDFVHKVFGDDPDFK
jgi:hypothetical protein